MSKGAFNELLVANPSKFKSMTKKMPLSEKHDVIKNLKKRVLLLENIR